MEMDLQYEDEGINGNFFTKLREVNGTKTIAILNNQLVFHAVTKEDVFNALKALSDATENSVFIFSSRYSSETF